MAAFSVHAATLWGMEAVPVTVEVELSGGIPGMTIVGMPDSAVLEARARIRSAFRSCEFEFPRLHVTVNLAPSSLKKTGTGFDLPIAAAILAAAGQIPRRELDGLLLVGELGLDGRTCEVRGAMAYALLARDLGLVLAGAPPFVEAAACSGIEGARQASVATLGCLRAPRLEPLEGMSRDAPSSGLAPSLDYADVVDQETPKRALAIAAAGSHGLIMVGPPGAGKTMLARRLPGILPALEGRERVEAMLVHSICSEPLDGLVAGERPFRSPHHSITRAGLIGGGSPVTPGEVSLAHRGVLFLDELPEFSPFALQALRQPMECGKVELTRAEGDYEFPSRFMLVAAANPCPCGHAGDPARPCRCAPSEVSRYQARVGGALLDRIDVFVNVARPAAARVIEGETGTDSRAMREQVSTARSFASRRRERSGTEGDDLSRSGVAGLGFSCKAASTLELMACRLALGGRGIARTARVARTIADMAESERVEAAHVAEACSLRYPFDTAGGLHG